MVETGKPHIPWDLSVHGRLLGMPDVYGNRFPPPETTVEFRTSDAHYISIMRKNLFGTEKTTPAGTFFITSIDHPKIIDFSTYYLDLTNSATGQKHRHNILLAYNKLEPALGGSQINAGEIQVPWNSGAPVIAKVNGREFKYPTDVARLLLQQFRAGNSSIQAELRFSEVGKPAPDTDLDSLFAVIDAESKKTGSSAKASKFLNLVAKQFAINLLKVLKPLDIVLLVLDKCSNPRYNTRDIRDFASLRLDLAVKEAFGVRSSPFFLGLVGRSAFALVLFCVGSILRGQKITVGTFDTASEHITSVSV